MKYVGTFVVAAGVALGIALKAPLAATVLGLIAFGVLHNVLELRYVAGRFGTVLGGRFLAVLLVLITAIAVCRLAAMVVGEPARIAEILVGYSVLAAACIQALRGWRRAAGIGVLVVASAGSLAFPGYHFVILAHLHNVVPLFFLWEWARLHRQSALFRWVQVGWVLGIPALILAGVFDGALGNVTASTVAAFAGDPARILAVSALPGSSPIVGARFLVVFAFLQTMHYFVWVYFMPRNAPEAALGFEQRVPWFTNAKAWAIGGGLGALLAVLLVTDYASGRALYGAFASYHAYLEFPVLLAGAAGSQLVFRETASRSQEPAAVSR